ncbi:hypothetical protein E1262_11240 [Jiangella aurantiaca]|uniref:HAF repeat-containing protein n=1 Tax=Jiangella aurantiaca TaxID=2530373 RepID=A0A4R5AIA6_9ACTN|nr:hypothetical protein [Jiangella aurantiaca]TDD69842.1 hypothetical protein E1262_11240 [Jiangella aurantiaca]
MPRLSSITPRLRILLAATIATAGLTYAQTAAADPSPSAHPPEFSFAEVGDLGGSASFPLDIARNGTVVGTARTQATPRPQTAFVHRDAARSLGTLPGSTFSRAMGVNARGQVVGEAFTAGAESSRAVIWDRRDHLSVLPGLRGPDSSAVANAINERGDVAGVSTASDGRATAVIWPRGAAPRALGWLDDLPGTSSRAWDIDTTGAAVGSMSVADGDDHFHPHAVAWDRSGVPTDLGVLEDHGSSTAYAVARGTGRHPLIVGAASLDGGTRAVVFGSSGPTALPTPGEFRHARANDVARQDWVVGHAAQLEGAPTFGGAAVLWVSGVAYRLEELTRDLPPGWSLQNAEAIDDQGRIVGYGTVRGEVRGFILTPDSPATPEPST